MDLKDVNEASPIELDEYEVDNKIYYELAFDWWVHYVFKKLYRIIAKSKTNCWRTKHEYGVRMPKLAAEYLELDM